MISNRKGAQSEVVSSGGTGLDFVFLYSLAFSVRWMGMLFTWVEYETLGIIKSN